jgi:hypothetical protein
MTASPDPQRQLRDRPGFAGVLATQRKIVAKRLTNTPAIWMSVPTWGRLWVNGRRLLGLDRRMGKGR